MRNLNGSSLGGRRQLVNELVRDAVPVQQLINDKVQKAALVVVLQVRQLQQSGQLERCITRRACFAST